MHLINPLNPCFWPSHPFLQIILFIYLFIYLFVYCTEASQPLGKNKSIKTLKHKSCTCYTYTADSMLVEHVHIVKIHLVYHW